MLNYEKNTLDSVNTKQDAVNAKPDTVKLREKLTPEQCLEKDFVSKTLPPVSDLQAEVEQTVFPQHLGIWQTPLSIHQQLDQAHLHQQVIHIENNHIKDIKSGLERSIENSQWMDETTTIEYGYETALLLSDSSSTTYGWVNDLEKYLSISLGNSKLRLSISKRALDILVASKGTVRGSDGDMELDLDALPLGFFLERAEKKCILKFSPELRLWQLESLPDAGLRLDPYVNKLRTL